MRKSNKELQGSNLFQALKVFENNSINQHIDAVYSLLEDNFGALENKIAVCGSVAKMMHGTLAEDYEPKDIDLLIIDRYFWRFIQRNINKIPARIKFTENRIILYFDCICIELWEHNMAEQVQRTSGLFKNKINYCYR